MKPNTYQKSLWFSLVVSSGHLPRAAHLHLSVVRWLMEAAMTPHGWCVCSVTTATKPVQPTSDLMLLCSPDMSWPRKKKTPAEAGIYQNKHDVIFSSCSPASCFLSATLKTHQSSVLLLDIKLRRMNLSAALLSLLLHPETVQTSASCHHLSPADAAEGRKPRRSCVSVSVMFTVQAQTNVLIPLCGDDIMVNSGIWLVDEGIRSLFLIIYAR